MASVNEALHQGLNEEFGATSSFQIIPIIDEHSSDVAEDQIEITTSFSNDNKRSFVDTSDMSVRFELNDSSDSVPITCRESIRVNTHDSILDLESQGGDDDMSFCDDELMGLLNLSSESKSKKSRTKKSSKKSKGRKSRARPVSPNQSIRKKKEVVKPSNTTEEESKENSGIMSSSTLYSMTDSFVDSICTSTVCVVSDNYEMRTNRKYKKDKTEQSSKAIVSMDIWELLGCSSPPGESELEQIWSLKTPASMLQMKGNSKSDKDSKQPVRASIKKRMKRIHRLRMDDRRISGASRHGVTITTHCIDPNYQSLNNIRNNIHMNKSSNAIGSDNGRNDESHDSYESQYVQPSYRAIDKSYSMLDDPLEELIGKGLVDPIPVQVEDGYDSDPEVNTYSASSPMVTDSPMSLSEAMDEDSKSLSGMALFPSPATVPEHRDVLRVNPIPTDEVEMRESVQQTLNSTWTLTWHPNAENRKAYNIPHSKPICINMWLERGAVMTNTGIVVEPAFMWRDAYQPLLLTQHKLNNSSQKPWSMRLLNACRISTYFSSPSDNSPRKILDRNKYPLARKNSSFLLKSCGGEEFLLEAKDPEDAIAITERWKLVVARFACLAVTEDVGGIAKEFFHPTSDSRMLTVPDPNNVF